MDVNTHSSVIAALSNTVVTNVSNDKAENNQSIKDGPVSVRGAEKVELSDQGKLFQKLDEKSEKVEDMLRANMTPEQAAAVEKSFQKIDAILEKDPLSAEDEKTLDKLSDEIDSAFASSVEKMSAAEKKEFNKLDSELENLERKFESMSEQELMSFQSDRQMPSGGFDSSSASFSGEESEGKQGSKNFNSLTTAQLNKLSALLLKKLSSIQLNKLNASQLNKLESIQLNQLSSTNQAKLNASQLAKLS